MGLKKLPFPDVSGLADAVNLGANTPTQRLPMTARHLLIPLFISLLALPAAAQNVLPLAFQPAPRPMPASAHYQAGITLELYFTSLKPGASGLLRLTGRHIIDARYSLRDIEAPFFAHADGDFYALLALDMRTPPASYDLAVTARSADADIAFALQVAVEPAGFILQEFDLPADRAHLVAADVEAAELDFLAQLTAEISSKPLWDASGFELPLDAPLASPFGSFRTLNGARQTRHTGWDQPAAIGTPIHAMAAGKVVYADRLQIRGNYILIDHGLGIYSGYAHFSELLARAGQSVAAGQIIGSSGSTGRSSGPHLHWEIAANGRWLDGKAFLDLWLPT